MPQLSDFQTSRLTARRMQSDDFELQRQLLRNPQVAATLGGLRNDEEVRQMLARQADHWNRHGFGLWIWHLREGGSFVGRGGLHNVFVGDHDEVEVGYALMPEFWGQGLATEIARASVNIAFTQLGLGELVSFTLPTNRASRRVMEKCGFTFERDIVWKELPHVLYRLKRLS